MNGIPITEWRMTVPRQARSDRILPLSRLAVFAAFLLVMTSHLPADAFMTPFIGDNFGGDSSTCAGLTDCSPRRRSYGCSTRRRWTASTTRSHSRTLEEVRQLEEINRARGEAVERHE